MGHSAASSSARRRWTTCRALSTGAYGYLELLYDDPPGRPDLPPYLASVNTMLATQTGICFQAERAFARIVRSPPGSPCAISGSTTTTPTESPDAHAAAEVYYDGDWHFFDPTFGQFWIDGAGERSLDRGNSRRGGTVHRDDALFTNLIEDPRRPAGGESMVRDRSLDLHQGLLRSQVRTSRPTDYPRRTWPA